MRNLQGEVINKAHEANDSDFDAALFNARREAEGSRMPSVFFRQPRANFLRAQ
jgi:hypothetical protein